MKKKTIRLWVAGSVFSLLVLLLGILGYLAYHITQVPVGRNTDVVYLYVGHERSMARLKEQIHTKLWPRRPNILELMLKYWDVERQIRVGRYAVPQGATIWELLQILLEGKSSPVQINLSGVRTEAELVDVLSRHLMAPRQDLEKIFTDSMYLQRFAMSRDALRSLFFAQIYTLPWEASCETLMDSVRQRYSSYWTKERLTLLDSLGLTQAEVATLASIVESESAKHSEYATIARLYLNRIKINMPLQSDPTVKFALGDFALRRILNEHLQVESPYNTYQMVGLPPGPIRLPMMSTIDSILRAPEHDYLYMCAKEDFSGYHRFAKDYKTHLQNARLYQRALNERGIK